MSINKRGSSWQVDVKVSGKRHRATFKDYDQALKYEAEARLALSVGKPVPSSQGSSAAYTFGQAVERTWTMHWADSKSVKQMGYLKEVLKNYFGSKAPLVDIKTDDLDDFVMKLKKDGKSNATINRHMAALSKIFKQAQKGGKIEKLPTFNKLKEGKGRIRWLSRDEESSLEELLRSWGENDIADAMIVSVDTGFRASELVGLEYRYISADGAYIGDTKNGDSRLVPLTARVHEILAKRKTVGRTRPFPYPADFYRSTWERARNHLELHDVVWHTLRHTCCSRLVQGGMPITHVKEWMGHRAIQTTMRYSHLCPSNLLAGLKLLEV